MDPFMVHTNESFLVGGATAGRAMRDFDWPATSLGTPAGWPESLKTLVSILLASNQPMFIAWGPQCTLLYNEAYAAILATKHPHAMGRGFLDVWSEIRDDLVPLVEKVFLGESVQMDDIELQLQRNGFPEEAHFSFFYSPVRDGDGAVSGLFCACNETTVQVQMQRQLREREARYRGVLDHMDEAFVLLDREFCLVELNEAALRMESRAREVLLHRSHWDLYPGTESSELGRMYKQCMADGVPRSLEHYYRWEDGRDGWFEVRVNRTPAGLALFYRDVSQRRLLERQAADSAERVQLALEAGAVVGTWVWNVDDNILCADARYAKSYGLDGQECHEGLALEKAMACLHPADRDPVARAINEALTTNGAYRCEYRIRQADGSFIWVEASGHVETRADGRRRFPGVLIDIQSRRLAQAERDHANTLLQTIVAAVPGVVYAKDLQGRVLVANQGTAELLGKPVQAILGRTDAEFLDDPAQAELTMAADRRIMDTGRSERAEEEVRRPDGTLALWLSTKAPLQDPDGKVIGLIVASVDISERKRVEETLRDSDRRKGEFLAVLSHELRNPLAPIRNSLHLLERVPPGSAAAARALAVIRRQSDQLSRLVDDLLDMTRISSGKIELQRHRIDLNKLVRRAAEDHETMLTQAGLRLQMQIEPTPLWLKADGTRISQVIGNLLHNAFKFTPAGGSLRLTTRLSGDYALLSVRDTGSGMLPGHVAGMFEAFAQGEQSLARSKGGLGLGLPLVKELVEMHGGSVTASSAGLDQGSEFEVRLPLESSTPATVEEQPPPQVAKAGCRKVLIVEDNVDAAESLAELLEHEGHSTHIAGDGRTGIRMARELLPDLVLCDIGLPGMDGHAVARALRQEPEFASTRLVALSGYAQAQDRLRSSASGFDDHLAKPPDAQQLLQLIAASRADRR
jgi:PAS domain S-box-containing protein